MDDGRAITITVDSETAEALEASVRAGEHPSVEAAASAIIDEWWADRAMESIGVERLRGLIQEGVDSGAAVDGNRVFQRLLKRCEDWAREKGE
ncbi:MAG: hypothetical protein ACREH4_15520 [Vitreimonas sp.]